jgi:hypothetical protein
MSTLRAMDRLVARLSISRQMQIIGVLAIVPAVVITLLMLLQANAARQFSALEASGVAYARVVWQGTASVLSLDASREDRSAGTALSALDAAHATIGPRFGQLAGLAAFKAALSAPSSDADRAIVVAKTGVDLMRDVADASNLTLDPEVGTFYLVDVTMVQLPDIARLATETRRAQAKTASRSYRAIAQDLSVVGRSRRLPLGCRRPSPVCARSPRRRLSPASATIRASMRSSPASPR